MSAMKYHLTYKVEAHPEGIEREDVDPKVGGACTAIVVGSLLYPPDGTYSSMFLTLDGRTGEPLHDDELFKAWTMLAARLSSSKELSPGKRKLAEAVLETVREAILSVRDGKNKS